MSVEDHNGQEERKAREIGALLARRRREKGLSLRDVEQATKIRTRYLEGLEREDYEALPDPVYVRGFLKTYANFLGLDGEQLSRELRDRRAPRRERQFVGNEQPWNNENDQPPIAPGGLGDAEQRRISGTTLLTITLAVLVLAVVGGALYLVGSRSINPPDDAGEAEQDALVQPGSEPSGSGTADEAEEGSAAELSDGSVQATVRVVGTSTGMTIRTDGTVAYEDVAQPGFSRTFEAQDAIIVEARDGGAVEVEVNGQDAERLASSGQPVTREFTPRSQS